MRASDASGATVSGSRVVMWQACSQMVPLLGEAKSGLHPEGHSIGPVSPAKSAKYFERPIYFECELR
jgi:hypothetical protein